jgi:cation-transporting ATPase 13A1
MTGESKHLEDRGEIDLEKKFEPTLLNTAIYLLGLSQQVSTFVLNFQVSCLFDVYIMVKADDQGRPFREGIRENPPLYYGLLGASLVAYSGASEFIPELNSWLQLVKMTPAFKVKLSVSMIMDFGLCFIVDGKRGGRWKRRKRLYCLSRLVLVRRRPSRKVVMSCQIWLSET